MGTHTLMLVLGLLSTSGEPTIEAIRDWARACLSVPGARVHWSVQTPVRASATSKEIASTFRSSYITAYRWPDCLIRDVLNEDERAGLRGRPDPEHSEIISPGGVRTYWSVPENPHERPRSASLNERATREYFYASYLLGCWLAYQPERLHHLTLEGARDGEITVRIDAPSHRVTFAGIDAHTLGITKVEVMGAGDKVLFAWEYEDLREIPDLPGRQGFRRRLLSDVHGEWCNINVDQLVSFTVHPRLTDEAFDPKQTMVAHKHPETFNGMMRLAALQASSAGLPQPAPPAAASAEPRSDTEMRPGTQLQRDANSSPWLWWIGAVCAAAGLGWLVRRRLAS